MRVEQLEARLRADYPICVQTLEVDDWSIPLWTIEQPDELLDALIAEAQGGENEPLRWEPYWAQSWESSFDCARAARQSELAQLQVMDLGCGFGAVGAAAASRGAIVHLVDNAQPALLFAKRNTWPWRDQISVVNADWGRDRIGQRFDCIFGADILYDRGQWDSLEQFWRFHLGDNGRLTLGEPSRRHSADFPEWLDQRGWTVQVEATAHGRLIHARRA